MKTLHERAYRAIKDLILKNTLLPGEELPINSLAGTLGISHTPVREALARLSADGLIDYDPHKKQRVATITEEDIRQVYEVRRLLEPHAANQVVSSISNDPVLEENVRMVHKKAKEIYKAPVDQISFEDCLAIDLGLNDIFVGAAGRTLFCAVLAFVGDRSLRIRTFLEAASKGSPNQIIHTITEEHLEIIRALLNQDATEAKKRVLRHLKNGETRTLKAIRKKVKI